jgi:hypothetical protein
MKTLGRIVIILVVTALVTAGLYALVTANGTGNVPSDFGRGGEQFQSGGALPEGVRPEGFRPGFEGGRGEHNERGEGGFGGGFGFIFGLLKNSLMIGLIVAILVLPKSLSKKKRLAAAKVESNDFS